MTALVWLGLSAGTARASHHVIYNLPASLAAALFGGAGPAPGANDWSCTPSAARPRPVVLLHGTFANQRSNWGALAPLLANNGYCVFSLNYGGTIASLGQVYGLAPIEQSAEQLRVFVDLVLSVTGASEVDIVGHSQGGMMPRYYLKYLGGAAKVNTFVALAPSNHGTSLNGLVLLAEIFGFLGDSIEAVCPACTQQIRGSDFMRDLDAGGDTVPGVNYTVIVSQYDQVVTPYTNSYLSGPNVTNINVQQGCFLDFSEHGALAFSRRALTYVLNALDPANPRPVPCLPVAALIGG